MPNPIYALILAGGTGSRLWPSSRTRHPKQFLELTGDQTMIQEALKRLVPLVPPERTYVATGAQYLDIVAKQLPGLPAENLIGEPVGRGTAAAIGLTAMMIRRKNPQAVMAVQTSDHLIQRVDVFRRALEAAGHVASEGWLVTLGIRPDYPETGYGYIERGDFLGQVGEFEGFAVRRFIEKPDLEVARAFVEGGNHDWNSGMFVWQVQRILEEMERHLPELYAGLDRIAAAIGTPDYQATLEEVFPDLPNVTIDYGIMEKAEKVAVLPIEIGWNDVGSWSSVFDVLPKDAANNAVVGRHISPDTRNSLIFSPNRLIATIGLDDFVIVDTDDVLLVCRRDRAQDVRKLVEILKQNGEAGYLDGLPGAEPLSAGEIRELFSEANSLEKALLSMLLHAGLWPSHIAGASSADFDLIGGWLDTPDGRRPLPNKTRNLIYAWMAEQDKIQFSFSKQWPGSQDLKRDLAAFGERAGVRLSIDRLYETLARALFEASEEGQVMRKVLGDEVDLVNVPLHALFPFSLSDFSGNESNELGERALRVLNDAEGRL
ncbi:MAG TPA: mannose-1-phosphate guanylyltransferase [Anaerolineales bacterium]|nr:mannose-1-phosphate guanylyltransferase [Anaerolineales bacterium]